MSEEKLKWQKTQKIGFKELIDNLNKLTNTLIKRELDDAMNKIEVLEKMGYIDKDNKDLIELKEKFPKIMESNK